MKQIARMLVVSSLLSQLVSCSPADPGPRSAALASTAPLDISTKNIVTSSKDGKFILLLDLFPFSQQLQSKSDKDAKSTVINTAQHYATIYGAKKENLSFAEVLVMVVYVK